jgi:CelD/BcsL family acetyltransferase involved in cellulose biosynthesis
MPRMRGRACAERHRPCLKVTCQPSAPSAPLPPGQPPKTMHVTEINRPEDLAALRLLWQALLGQTRGATFFHSLDWLEAYWRHYGHEQRLRVLVVRSGDEVLGIVPLVVRQERTRLGRLRMLTYPLDDWGVFYGPIGPQPAACLTAALAHLRARPRDWDLISLRWVHRDAHDQGRSERAMRFVGWRPQEEIGHHAPAIDLRGGWEAYWSSRGHRWRGNVNRSERKLAAAGGIEYVRYRPEGAARGDGDPRWDLFDACRHIAQQSWQGSSPSGTTLSHASVEHFLRDAHQTAAHAGGLDLNLLYVAGRPAAFAYNYHYHGHLYGLRMGYDPVVTRDGAGTVLWRKMIEDSFARGDHTFDLGPDSLEVKKAWQTSVEISYRYTCYAPAPRPQALRLKRGLQAWRRRA